jgi:hypothetical protein
VSIALVNSATADQEKQSSAPLASDGSMTRYGVIMPSWLLLEQGCSLDAAIRSHLPVLAL